MSDFHTAISHVHRQASHLAFQAQETEQGGDTPDINRLPDHDLPDFGGELPDVADDLGVPPFTGEDVEDAGKRRRHRRPLHDQL